MPLTRDLASSSCAGEITLVDPDAGFFLLARSTSAVTRVCFSRGLT